MRNEFNWTPLSPSLKRYSPSSELVMIDRTFNQEERTNLTQDKRMVLVDPGKNKECFVEIFIMLWTDTNCKMLLGCPGK